MIGLKLLLLNGPNLNMLGTREPEIYGSETLPELVNAVRGYAADRDVELRDYQSNIEGELVTAIQEARLWADGILMNPGAYTHTSIAMRDAISGIDVPVVELHISNVHAREPFRHKSMLSGVCLGVIAGFGRDSYFLAIEALIRHLS
ncbi:MAG: type II 3-dehydroquinate dehydratase [Ardenticatenaceae bacterium]|nr:type II 3-dehydroquinate dehydratase [Ardenticatenaceae bacterium]